MSYARGSNIAKHAWSSNHSIDFKNSQSWHTALIDHADKSSGPLPNQYSILFKKRTISLLTLIIIFHFSFLIFSLFSFTYFCIYVRQICRCKLQKCKKLR